MSNWECDVCGYIHKEAEPPEKCPICEAPRKMFKELSEEKKEDRGDRITENSTVEGKERERKTKEIKKWRCSISGYLHTGTEPPETCPICEATAEQFEEVIEKEEGEGVPTSVKRWRCSVCGYIHEGDEPPEKCPVCAAPASMFVEIDFEGRALGEPEKEEIVPLETKAEEAKAKESSSFVDVVGKLILKLHLHPITVHFPNGILPAAVIFLALAVYFKISLLESVAYYNFIFVLVMLPVVLFTGYMEWQKRYNGAKTALFITKILCSIIVLASVNVLVFWRLLDEQVAAAGSSTQLIYLGIAAVALGAAGIAGHLGGKLVFGARP